METVAYELRAEYAETVTQTIDGEEVETRVFQGAVLAVGDGDLHVSDELARGDGVIVVKAHDGPLIDLLDAYPALKRTDTPDGATPISPFERRTREALDHVASLRDFTSYRGDSRDQLVRRLDAHDDALHDGDVAQARAIAAGDPAAIVGKARDGLDGLPKGELEQLAEQKGISLEGAANNSQRIEALRAAGVRKES